ncbi:transcriptional regulator GcvA [Dongia soli]|uniref:Transcriptional regulator GcvA n=1 Tax=Dongia soli TaxID=600628 RepID=A0ABU5E7K1_9PROT|nr:transcriptional regulator GcvA [Dongia soli]MDY0882158.1 transcriptional regulator GcvA [Dongia soli]
MVAYPPLKAVRYFEAAARHLSFSKAAEELSVTHSAISHQIKALESWLGVPLFERGTRQVALTDAGRRFLPPVRSGLLQIAEAARDVSIATRGGPIVVSVLPSVAARWLVPKLHDFRSRHPDIDVRISATGRVETIGDGDIDIAIRFGRGHWSGVTAELLLANDLFPVCSPKLPSEDKPLKEPRDLLQYPLLTDSDWAGANYDFWRDWLTAAGVEDARYRPGLSFNVSNLLMQAAVDGLGIAIGNTMLAGEDLRQGRLIRPFDFTVWPDSGFYVCYAKSALQRPKIKAFRDWLFDQIEVDRQMQQGPNGRGPVTSGILQPATPEKIGA